MYTLTDVKGARQCETHSHDVVPAELAEAQGVGDYVQVRFEQENRTESMWLKIDEVLAGGERRGTLENDPMKIKGLLYGASVTFHTDHVRRIIQNGHPFPFPQPEAGVRYVMH